MEANTFLCTRPKLASKLMAAGYVGRQTVNTWSPERTAWEFDKCEALMEIVTQYTFTHDMAAARRRREQHKAKKKGGDANEV